MNAREIERKLQKHLLEVRQKQRLKKRALNFDNVHGGGVGGGDFLRDLEKGGMRNEWICSAA